MKLLFVFEGEKKSMMTQSFLDLHGVRYHAFCVGFDSEDTSESTWLCPR